MIDNDKHNENNTHDPDSDLFEKVKDIDTSPRDYTFKDVLAFSIAAFQVLMPAIIAMIAVVAVVTLIIFVITD